MAGPRGKPGAKAPGARILATKGRTIGTVQRRPSGKGITNFRPGDPDKSGALIKSTSSQAPKPPGSPLIKSTSSQAPKPPGAPTPAAKPTPKPASTPKPRATAKPSKSAAPKGDSKPRGDSKPKAGEGGGQSNASIADETRALYRRNKKTIGDDRNMIHAGTTLDLGGGKKYRVKKGDSLWKIAAKTTGG